MNVVVDRNKCVGCGNCASVCPVTFELEDTKAVAKRNPVFVEFERATQRAVDSCPAGAITVKAPHAFLVRYPGQPDIQWVAI